MDAVGFLRERALAMGRGRWGGQRGSCDLHLEKQIGLINDADLMSTETYVKLTWSSNSMRISGRLHIKRCKIWIIRQDAAKLFVAWSPFKIHSTY